MVGSLFVLICSGYMVLINLFALIVEFVNIPYRGDNNAHEFAYLLKQEVFYIILFIVLILIKQYWKKDLLLMVIIFFRLS